MHGRNFCVRKPKMSVFNKFSRADSEFIGILGLKSMGKNQLFFYVPK